ncbi:hypothetical protein [Geobacillus kaustophilus]
MQRVNQYIMGWIGYFQLINTQCSVSYCIEGREAFCLPSHCRTRVLENR